MFIDQKHTNKEELKSLEELLLKQKLGGRNQQVRNSSYRRYRYFAFPRKRRR